MLKKIMSCHVTMQISLWHKSVFSWILERITASDSAHNGFSIFLCHIVAWVTLWHQVDINLQLTEKTYIKNGEPSWRRTVGDFWCYWVKLQENLHLSCSDLRFTAPTKEHFARPSAFKFSNFYNSATFALCCMCFVFCTPMLHSMCIVQWNRMVFIALQ